MPSYRKVFIIALVALVVVLGGTLAYFVFRQSPSGQPKYTAVYLSTGEIYIGQLSRFPRLTLTKAYLLQLVREQPATDKEAAIPASFQLAPLSDVVWAPQRLNLNPKQVIFSAPLRDDSQVVQGIEKKAR